MPGGDVRRARSGLVALSEKDWGLIEPVLCGRWATAGRPAVDARRNLEGIRWVAWTGRPWSQLPPERGKPDSVRRYYLRLKSSGRLAALLAAFPNVCKGDYRWIERHRVHQQLAFIADLDADAPVCC